MNAVYHTALGFLNTVFLIIAKDLVGIIKENKIYDGREAFEQKGKSSLYYICTYYKDYCFTGDISRLVAMLIFNSNLKQNFIWPDICNINLTSQEESQNK